MAQIEDNLKCVDFVLSANHRKQLDNASKIELGFPHDFLVSTVVRDFAFKGQLAKISNPNDPISKP